jgi:pilus assembly protein CpaB
VAYAQGLKADAASSRAQALANYGGEQVEVLVATRDIAPGESIGAENVSRQTWVSALLPAGAVLDINDAQGKTASMPIMRNEPLVEAKLGGMSQPLSVPSGLCAVSIPVDDTHAVGGAVIPGMAVDVYAASANVVMPVVEDVLVLETSSDYGQSKSESAGLLGSKTTSRPPLKWVTLAVDPSLVQQLLASARDKVVYLVLPGNDVARRAIEPEANTGIQEAGAGLLQPEASDSPEGASTEDAHGLPDKTASPASSPEVAREPGALLEHDRTAPVPTTLGSTGARP